MGLLSPCRRASGSPPREHLFINYAIENTALAEWLTRKLTAEGYRVWCDRLSCSAASPIRSLMSRESLTVDTLTAGELTEWIIGAVRGQLAS